MSSIKENYKVKIPQSGENKHIYSVRIDTNASYDTKLIIKFLKKVDASNYLFGRETGTVAGRHHFQGVIWCKEKLSSNAICGARNMVTYQLLKDLDYSGSEKAQPMSFCYAKNPKSLVSYCTKAKNLFTNLSPKDIAAIPEWLPLKEWKNKEKEKLKAQLQVMVKDKLELSHRSVQNPPTFNQFCILFHDSYFEVYNKYCFYKNTFYRSALEHKIISRMTFLEKIGVIDGYCNNDHYEPDHSAYESGLFAPNSEDMEDFWREEQIRLDKRAVFEKS